MSCVLVVSSDTEWCKFTSRGLREFGHIVDEANNATDSFFFASGKEYDCIILDRNLQDIFAISLLSFMRANGIETPVIMVSTRDDLEETLAAFEAGTDDYLCQPVRIAELAARVAAIARRGVALKDDGVLSVCDLSLHRFTRQVWRSGRQIPLQPRSYCLLETLMENAGSVVTRTMLLESVWEYHFDPSTSVIETQISRLREKVDRPFQKRLIRTVRGAGYMIGEPATPVRPGRELTRAHPH